MLGEFERESLKRGRAQFETSGEISHLSDLYNETEENGGLSGLGVSGLQSQSGGLAQMDKAAEV